jgi:hypothetical protein
MDFSLATISVWVWLRTAPRKPDPIPPGEFRIQNPSIDEAAQFAASWLNDPGFRAMNVIWFCYSTACWRESTEHGNAQEIPEEELDFPTY